MGGDMDAQSGLDASNWPSPPTNLILDAVKISGFVVENQVFSPLI
jgi:hypothetical protein